ncbi:MAG TPA: hypothetical protein VGH65_11145, partial [Verrucomicrobiaceae bacterium]
MAIFLLAGLDWADAQNLFGGANQSSITNYTGIVVQTGGAYGVIPVQGGYLLQNFNNSTVTQTFHLGFKLVNGAGGTVINEVLNNDFVVNAPAHTNPGGTQSAFLNPPANSIATFDPTDATTAANTTYFVSTQLYRKTTGGGYIALGSALSPGYRFNVVAGGSNAGIVGYLDELDVTQSFAVATAVGGDSFQLRVQGVLGRLEQTGQPIVTDNYQIFLDATVTGAATGQVVNSRTAIPVALANHTLVNGPTGFVVDQMVNLHPDGQIDSTDSYTIVVNLSYAGTDNIETLADTASLSSQRLLHFNGTLLFGGVTATISAISNVPLPLGTIDQVGENTTLGLPLGGAILTGNPGYTISTDNDLAVLLHIDGTAEVTDTENVATVAPPAPTDGDSLNGVSFTRDGITLDTTGATAMVSVKLPAGFGVALGTQNRRMLGVFPAGTIALDSNLKPASNTVTLSAFNLGVESFDAVHEELPLFFACHQIVWDTAAATFTVQRTSTFHVRRGELNTLDTVRNTLSDPTAADRPSNEGYFRDATGNDWVVITADAQGRAVLTTAAVTLPASNFTAHFPAGVNVAWTQPGAVVISNGQCDTAQSALPGAADATFTTSPGAPSNPSPAGNDSFTFTPDGGTWNFTPDGGLHAAGTITGAPLRWDARDATHYVQTTDSFTDASAHLPGHVMLGSLATTSDDNRPGEVLLTGFGKPDDPAYIERPGDAESYAAGLADYAGLNFRALTDGAVNATSLIGDASVGPYPLRGTSKYYIRLAGISGIHEAVTSAFASQGAIIVHGFPLTLNNYQLSFLDNADHDSLITGTVGVPAPRPLLAGISQPFTKLIFDLKGEPTDITLPEPNT